MKKPENPENLPALRIDNIPTEERHFAAFGVKHPMERSFVTGFGINDEGQMLVEGLDIQETFTLVNPVMFPAGIHINVSGIKQALAWHRLPFRMMRATLDEEWYQYVLRTNDVEEKRIKELTAPDLARPGIMAVWTMDWRNTTMIDGAHRLVRRWRDGVTTFEMAMVFGPTIERFVRPVDGPTDKYVRPL